MIIRYCRTVNEGGGEGGSKLKLGPKYILETINFTITGGLPPHRIRPCKRCCAGIVAGV